MNNTPKTDQAPFHLRDLPAHIVPPDSETYKAPAEGWTCFHCGENFRSAGSARIHFGATPDRMPGCLIKVYCGGERGLLQALRKTEDELVQLRQEDGEIARELVRLQSRHSEALNAAEETGYARGIRDAAKMSRNP